LHFAVSFNYYANSTFTDREMYNRPAAEAAKQEQYMKGVVAEKQKSLNAAYDALSDKLTNKTTEGEK